MTSWQKSKVLLSRQLLQRWLLYQVRRVLALVLGPQETFNAAVVDYINHKQQITPEELRSRFFECYDHLGQVMTARVAALRTTPPAPFDTDWLAN